jgi:hypothetical protein
MRSWLAEMVAVRTSCTGSDWTFISFALMPASCTSASANLTCPFSSFASFSSLPPFASALSVPFSDADPNLPSPETAFGPSFPQPAIRPAVTTMTIAMCDLNDDRFAQRDGCTRQSLPFKREQMRTQLHTSLIVFVRQTTSRPPVQGLSEPTDSQAAHRSNPVARRVTGD